MEQEKKKSGVNALLVVIIIVLVVLCVLFATGIVSFNGGNSANNGGKDNTTNDIDRDSKDNLYDNIEMDKKTLDELYYLIGALPEDGEEITTSRHCLNVAVTNTTYLGIPYAKDVFSWYVTTYHKAANYDKYKDANMRVDGANLAVSAYQCDACFTIEKAEVEKFKQLYYFGPEEKFEFIKDNVVNYDNLYSATQSIGSPVQCVYNVKHNITKTEVSKGTDGETIYLTDEQLVTRYDDVENGDISQLTKQTINYSFYKKNGSDVYQLNRAIPRSTVK